MRTKTKYYYFERHLFNIIDKVFISKRSTRIIGIFFLEIFDEIENKSELILIKNYKKFFLD